MSWLLVIAAAVAMTEVLLRLPTVLLARRTVGLARRAMRVLASQTMSEIRKERLMLVYACLLARNSAALLAIGVTAALPVLAIAGFAEIGGVGVWGLLQSVQGLLAATVAAFAFLAVRLHVRRS